MWLKKVVAFGASAAAILALMGPSGGFPSRPRFQAVGVNAAVPAAAGDITASGTITGTHAGSGAALTSLSAANISAGTLAVARGGTGVTTSTGSGNTVLSTSPALTTPTVGGQQVCVANGTNCPIAETSSTWSATLATGCTTTPSYTLRYTQTGNIVNLHLGQGNTTCTGNSTIRSTDASMPVAIRPAAQRSGMIVAVQDNTVQKMGCINIATTGVVSWGTLPNGIATDCSTATSTAAGTWAPGGFSVVYSIN